MPFADANYPNPSAAGHKRESQHGGPNLLKELTGLIEEQCRLAAQYGIFGTQEFHLESVERLEDKDGAFNFLVTTWDDVSENPRQKEEMSLFELMDLLGRVIGHRAINDVEIA